LSSFDLGIGQLTDLVGIARVHPPLLRFCSWGDPQRH
jgi:hypothetical protein